MIKYIALILLCGLTACRGPEGHKGTNGVDGKDGVNGIDGRNGENGATGPVGTTGPAGADGHIAVVIPLCAGTPTYASVFVEVALCINQELYAVYSANGGFLTKILPGTYSSNAIGSRCDFKVIQNCQIEEL